MFLSDPLKRAFSLVFLISLPLAAGPLDPRFANQYADKAAKSIQKHKIHPRLLGIQIAWIAKDGAAHPFYSLNEDRLFIPASLVKIASLSAFWHYFPSHFRFQTRLVSAVPVSGGVLQGDLVIQGGGDPGFTSESLWNLARAFQRTGIRRIEGDILADASLYKAFPFRRNSNRSFHALPSAASLNWNSQAFWIRKGAEKPLVFPDPELPNIQIQNQLRYGRTGRVQIETSPAKKGDIFLFKGFVDPEKEESVFYRNVRSPPLYLGQSLRLFLQKEGVAVSGHVLEGVCRPAACRALAKWESRPLSWHTSNMMKFSNNFAARMLTTHLPIAFARAKKGDFSEGVRLIRKYLKETAGIQKFHLEEPAGLSRQNRFSPKALQKMLLQKEGFFAPEILSAYPLRREGTLKTYFKSSKGNLLLRAKTGSLSGVSGLAGFAEADGRRFVFVFIFNGRAKGGAAAPKLFQELIHALFD